MLKNVAIVVVVLVAIGVGLYIAGVRVSPDGSGWKPRFWSRGPHYAALEADRARQRERTSSPPSASAPGSSPAADVAKADAQPATGSSSASAPPAPAVSRPPRGYWPDFRGPNRDGRYVETAIRTDWPASGLPLVWKQPIGLGYASFVVADGRAYTIEQRRQQEVVTAYDVETGRELWAHGWDGEFKEGMGGDGPRATPMYHDGIVYALGALGELRALNARDGKLVWRHDILSENSAANLIWGMSSSPLIVDDKVIVLPGGPGGKSIVAYHKTTGARVWSSLGDSQAYVSPMLVTLAGVRQLLVVSATRAMGLTIDEGRLLWEYPWTNYNGISVAQPLLLGDDRVFLSAGYSRGAAAFRVTRAGNAFAVWPLWANTGMKNKFTSSVLREGYIYGLDEFILACLDATTGEQKWKGGRYGYGQVVLAGDRLIVLTESGEVAMVKAMPDRHEEVARFAAIEGRTWNHPVITDGRLLVRNGDQMAAFDVRPR